MVKKLSKKQSRAFKPPGPPPTKGAAELLREGARLLRRSDLRGVLRFAAQAEGVATRPEEAISARALAAEGHFRHAARTVGAERLAHLERALEATPDDARFLFHSALTRWRLGDLASARAALARVAEIEPGRPGLPYLRALLDLGRGAAAPPDSLTPEEAATLRFVASLIGAPGADGSPPTPEPQPLWEALREMRVEPSATPRAALRAAALSKGTPAGARGPLHYYVGVAAMRADAPDLALEAWKDARADGFDRPWLSVNLAALLREQAVAAAESGEWARVAQLARLIPQGIEDRILTETVALAHFHLGYEAAQKGRWSAAATHWRSAQQQIGSRQLAQNLALAEEALENWTSAAEAWREMARRRPRRSDHPDYLDDGQVAALWRHAASCYLRADEPNEAISCLKTALKYSADEAPIRLDLADALLANGQEEAAMNELERLLKVAPDHVEALVRLASLQGERWGMNPIPLWKRVLELDPGNEEARQGLTAVLLEKAQFHFWGDPVRTLEEGLSVLPEEPALLIALAKHHQKKAPEQAREYLVRASRSARGDIEQLGDILHELLHIGGEAEATALLAEIRDLPTLLPGFWLSQGYQELACKLDEAWARRFFDEALAMVGRPQVEQSRAALLAELYLDLNPEDRALREPYERMLREEAPTNGAVELVEAEQRWRADDRRGAERLLDKARRLARRARDESLLEQIEQLAFKVEGRPDFLSPGMLARLMRLFPDGPPSPEDLENLPDGFFDFP